MQCPHIGDQNVSFSVQGKLIYKDQCTKCFIEAKSDDGISVCLKCFNGGCVSKLDHSHEHFQKSGHCLGLRVKVSEEEQVKQRKEDIQKLAIGKEGGFQSEQIDYKVETRVYCYLCKSNVESEKLNGIVQSIKNTDSAFKKSALASWEYEVKPCEHTLTMEQVPKFKIQGQNLATCQSCDLSNNLWLCLCCGSLGCGRKNFDGSNDKCYIFLGGGNGHAMQHFSNTNHSLVVKLGTITPEGGASVHCYTCGDEVIDNFLQDHLANFGIDIQNQTKTEKSIAELTLDANIAFQLSKSIEEGKILEPVFGPSYTGIDNIGNSCYMNSVIQALFHIKEFQQQYFQNGQTHQQQCQKFPINCFTCQMSKIAFGLHSGLFCEKKEDKPFISNLPEGEGETQEKSEGIRLYDFKQLVAKGNNEFLSNRQQDAMEYLDILFKFIMKGEKTDNLQQTQSLFEFNGCNLMTCTNCGGSKINSYKSTEFKVPVEHPTPEQIAQWQLEREATLKKAQEEGKPQRVDEDIPEYHTTFKRGLQILQGGDQLQINCPRCNEQQMFMSQQYFQTFPEYLITPIQRFVLDQWVPKKLNAMIEVQEHIDFKDFLVPNIPEENLLKDKAQQVQKEYTQENVIAIVGMGFTENAAKRALTQNGNQVDAALQWIMERMDDPAINDPIIEKQAAQDEGPYISPENINNVVEMGFTVEEAKFALKKTDNNLERAMDYIFNHNIQEEVAQDKQQQQQPKAQKGEQQVGSSKYELYAAIVHLGRSTHSGHYVVYIKKDGQWILYNDSKVAKTPNPVLGKGYIYIFKRV